jgi:Ser/Thr protein kinase RdoA (MazF antagonist)
MAVINKILLELNNRGFSVANPHYMFHNLSNVSYQIVFDGKDAVLKVFLAGPDPGTALEKEIRGLKIAKAISIPAPEIYFRSDSKNLLYVVRQFIGGESVTGLCQRLKEHKLDIIEASGKMLATLHSAQTEAFKTEEECIQNAYAHLKNREKETRTLALQSGNKELCTLIEKFFPYFNQQYALEDTMCFVHGDYKFSNILTDGTAIVGLIDWEHSGYGLAMEDVGRACVFPAEVVTAFLKGYNAKSRTAYSDIVLLKDLFYVRTAAEFFAKKHLPTLNPKRVAEFESHLNHVLTELLIRYR